MANSNPIASWKPGQSGNPNGRPKRNNTISEEMRKILRRRVNGKTHRRLIAEKLVEMAVAGELAAIKLLMNYIDGKPVQRVETSGPEQGAIVVVRYETVEAEKSA